MAKSLLRQKLSKNRERKKAVIVSRTLEERAEQTASRGDQLSCFIMCAVSFS